MVNDDNALIERLRFEQVIRKYDDGRTLTQKLNPDGNDAANRIEALSAENERLRDQLEYAVGELSKYRAKYMVGTSPVLEEKSE